MKRLLLLFVASILLAGCSKDDDSETIVTNKEKLIAGSIWNYQSVKVLQIIDEDTEVTMSEMQTYLDEYFDFTFSYNFKSDGKVTIKYDADTIEDNYTISNDNGQNNFTLDLANSFTYTKCSVNSTFVYEVIDYVFMPWGEDVSTLLRFTFN